MAPFKLEGIKYNPNDRRIPKMLYCKKEYNKKVKITDWNLNLEYQPIDTNPYNPNCFRLHNSHYERLGNRDESNPSSETHDSLKNGIIKSAAFEHDPHKYLVNVYTCECFICKHATKVPCPKICAEYITTMQASYEAPHPCKIKGLVMPVVGNQKNKHMGAREECKFLDDNFTSFTKTLQGVKGFRHVSYNPCTGMNTDGSIC